MNTLNHLRLPVAVLTCGAALVGGVAAAAPAHAAPASSGPRQVVCHGTATACTATVSIAGGASNRRVDVRLPATGMRLTSVHPTSRDLNGAYLISDQGMRNGGRDYRFTLNSVQAPRGSALKLQFRAPTSSAPQIVRCQGSQTCQARVPLGGGASNRRVVVQLPRTDLGLVAVTPSSPDLRGSYALSQQKLRAGHSEYAFVLNAVAGTPRGSYLTLTFRTV